jgi:hypothetical protein
LLGVASVSELAETLTDESATAAQRAVDTSTKVADGIATKDQLRTVETGQFNYAFGTVANPKVFIQTQSSGLPVSITGVISASVDIDFGARTIGGGNSRIRGGTSSIVEGCSGCTGSIAFDETIEAQSFASGSGNATFTDVGGNLTATITLNNADGVVAATAPGKRPITTGRARSAQQTAPLPFHVTPA